MLLGRQLCGGFLLVFATGIVAGETNPVCSQNNSSGADDREPAQWTFLWENDIGNSDRWYTNGMKLSRASTSITCPLLALDEFALSRLGSNSEKMVGWSFGMNMYTPIRITIASPQPNDRPWNGWMYVGRNWGSRSDSGQEIKVELLVGGLGKWAHQDTVQKTWHKIVNADEPMGWANQKGGKPGVSISAQVGNTVYSEKLSSGRNVSAKVTYGFGLGNVVTQVNGGADANLAFGDEDAIAIASNINVPPIAPALAPTRGSGAGSAVSLSMGVHVKGVAYSTFLKGTEITTVPVVADVKLFGVSWAAKSASGHVAIGLQRILRSPEFKTSQGDYAPWQKIWQLAISWAG